MSNITGIANTAIDRSPLDDLARQGAQQMLAKALELEVQAYLEDMSHIRDKEGRKLIVRNGTLPKRSILTGAGELDIEQPRVRDKRGKNHEEACQFTSKILPPYLRRSTAMNELIPFLYLKGISSGDFSEALQALTGTETQNVSANTVTRLTEEWSKEQKAWTKRDLSQKEYVYFWADGIHVKVRLDGEKQCILVVMGALKNGKKELVGFCDGYRESEQSWNELLLSLKSQGLKAGPKLAIGDGALGFWKALRKAYPSTKEQRCWFHKAGNILNKLPKSVQPKAEDDLHQIWLSDKRETAYKAFELFIEKYDAKYPKATECLLKDKEELLNFYDFPAEQWAHIRTTNPIESTFATVRLRHKRTKGSGSRRACFAMVFKLVQAAEKRWRRLKGYEKITYLFTGGKFKDGVLVKKDAA